MINHELFLSTLKKDSVESSKLSDFISSFPLNASIPLKRKLIFRFLKSVQDSFPQVDRELVQEGWEKVVTWKLYSKDGQS